MSVNINSEITEDPTAEFHPHAIDTSGKRVPLLYNRERDETHVCLEVTLADSKP